MNFSMPPRPDWKKALTPLQYRILREEGTEAPFSGQYNTHFADGTYNCVGCGQPLFDSGAKFASQCGWPAFDAAATKLDESNDKSLGMTRIKVNCPRCQGHLGHRFDDGPSASGTRYCINSAALAFNKQS